MHYLVYLASGAAANDINHATLCILFMHLCTTFPVPMQPGLMHRAILYPSYFTKQRSNQWALRTRWRSQPPIVECAEIRDGAPPREAVDHVRPSVAAVLQPRQERQPHVLRPFAMLIYQHF